MAQPNSGRIGRSPGAVARTSRIASSISRSPLTRAMPPVGADAQRERPAGADELLGHQTLLPIRQPRASHRYRQPVDGDRARIGDGDRP